MGTVLQPLKRLIVDSDFHYKAAYLSIRIYFLIAVVLMVSEVFEWKEVLVIFKPLLIPLLMTHYWIVSKKRNKLYLIALLFAVASNILLLNPAEYLISAIFVFTAYRILIIILLFRLIVRPPILPLAIATVPFIFIFSFLFNLTLSYNFVGFYPTVINGVLISLISGLAFSSYILNDNKANSWLAISTLLFIVLEFLFMIQKFYLYNIAFQPMSALLFTFAHYAFFRFILRVEKSQTAIERV